MSKNSRARSTHGFLTLSGLTARALLLAVRHVPEPTDIVLAAAYGMVELLGARRFYKILGKAIRTQIRSQLANTNTKRRASVPSKPTT